MDQEETHRQLDTAKIKWGIVKMGVSAPGCKTEVSVDIAPDEAIFGTKFVLIYTIPQFQSKFRSCLDEIPDNYDLQLYNLFILSSCIGTH